MLSAAHDSHSLLHSLTRNPIRMRVPSPYQSPGQGLILDFSWRLADSSGPGRENLQPQSQAVPEPAGPNAEPHEPLGPKSCIFDPVTCLKLDELPLQAPITRPHPKQRHLQLLAADLLIGLEVSCLATACLQGLGFGLSRGRKYNNNNNKNKNNNSWYCSS